MPEHRRVVKSRATWLVDHRGNSYLGYRCYQAETGSRGSYQGGETLPPGYTQWDSCSLIFEFSIVRPTIVFQWPPPVPFLSTQWLPGQVSVQCDREDTVGMTSDASTRIQ